MNANGTALFHRQYPAKNGKRVYLSGHDLDTDGGVVELAVPVGVALPPLFERVTWQGKITARMFDRRMSLGVEDFTFKALRA